MIVLLAQAQTTQGQQPTAFETIRDLLFGPVIEPLLILLFAIAFIYFLYGVARYIMSGESPEKREYGKQHMIWGIVGLGIMISAFGIAVFIFNSVTAVGGGTGLDNKPIKTPSILQEQNQGF